MCRNKLTTYLCLALMILFVMSACKPTEQGYKQAYDIARQKERAGMDDITFERMNEDSKPALVEINGVRMRKKGDFLQIVYPQNIAETESLKRFNVAIGEYKMLFNAQSHTDRLLQEKLPAMTLRTAQNIYYVIIGSYDSETNAAMSAKEYISSHKNQFVAMQEPLLLISAH